MSMSVTIIPDSERRLRASSIYSEPLEIWETRILRLEPVQDKHDGEETVEVHLEIAVIPHMEGLGLVETGKVVSYEALSYTWESNVFSHTIRCNGLDFSVTANLHAALVQLRRCHVHRWLFPDLAANSCSWIDALCIDQYDDGDKERQVRNMFHIYRKAITVLVWLGPAGPTTSLGADIVNIYEEFWKKDLQLPFHASIRNTLGRKSYRDSGKSICVDEFLIDLQKRQSSKYGQREADTLGLLSMAWDGIVDFLGRAWFRRTWIIQEMAAAARVKFHCGPSVLSYDAFYEAMPSVGAMVWNTRDIYLAGKEDMLHQHRIHMRQGTGNLDSLDLLDYIPNDGPVSFEESSTCFGLLHQLRQLIHNPAHHISSRCTQTELLLVLLVEAVSRGFEASVAVDRVYSLTAMADAISSALRGLVHNERKASSPQRLPVDYSVDLRTAVLRALKIRMNEIRYFYVAIKEPYKLDERGVEESMDCATKSVILSICTFKSSVPSWLILLAFRPNYLARYNHLVDKQKHARATWASTTKFWTEQDVTEPDTLVLRGKALGRLVIDSEEQPSRAWVALPCPLGQEFETCVMNAKPIRALHQGHPDDPPVAAIRESLDDAKIASEARRALSLAETDSGLDRSKVTLWNWQFPSSARDGDVVVVFVGTCALVRPLPQGKYEVVADGLRVPVDRSHQLDDSSEIVFLRNHCDNLDNFVLT